ncbi:MAG: 7-cyano-7-deazaguanine synthase [Chloroflexi bacterium]|nr:7-cyano-7-deazaguanine synthase [Chloroflexota bacterium]
MRRCSLCVLPETFPGAYFDDEGLCAYCRQHKNRQGWIQNQRAAMRARFDSLVQDIRGQNVYDCLVAWSGGKDSTYTLFMLRESYRLNVLAVTFDNGFISPAAWENMERMSERLGVDHLIVRPRFDLLRQIFATAAQDASLYSEKALTRASAICNACMSLAKGVMLRTALEKHIPLIAYGWSPGQSPITSAIYKRTPEMAQAMAKTLMEPLQRIAGEAVRPYFPQEREWSGAEAVPYDVSPLAFWDYAEAHIRESIRALGWRDPADTDPNSTNCLLNSLANVVHMQQKGYHPYALELSALVREGYLDREEALRRLGIAQDSQVVEQVRNKLGL